MLKLKEVSAHYGDVQALRGVSFAVKEGEIVSIIGSNGAGKSTTLNTDFGNFAGFLRNASNFWAGGSRTFIPTKSWTREWFRSPKGRLLFPFMSVLENLELGAFNEKARMVREERNLKNVFSLFPILQERMNQLAGTLSGGEQQMLAIARGLMAMPKLLMLDEPSLGLAPLLVRQVFETVKAINAQGITVLLVEQNVFHCLSAAARGYVLENGSVVLEGGGKELLNNPQVREAYLGI